MPAMALPSDNAANEGDGRTRAHFQRTLGSYPLCSSSPAALLLTRRHRHYDAASDGVRGHGCALAASS
eukprot:1253110-Pleurochrysis_carterae.AAC.1